MNQTKPRKGYKFVKGLFGKYEEIPKDWKIDIIQNYAKITTGSKNTQDKINNGKYPFFIRSQKIKRINSYSYDGEAVLTAGDGAIGKIFHYTTGKFDFHQRVYKISDFNHLLHGYFFFLYFSFHFLNHAMSMSAKNTVDSIRFDMISKMPILLPPLSEQQKIASILSNVDTLIENTQKIIDTTIKLKKGLMQKLLTKGIGHTKFKKINWFFGKELSIPEEWDIETINNIAHLNPEIIKNGYNFDQIEYVAITSIKNFQITKSTNFKLDERPSRAQRIVQQDDILISTVRPYLKAFSMIEMYKPNLICSTGFCVLRSKISCESMFLFNYLKSYLFEVNFIRKMEGMAYPAITPTTVGNSLIPIPNNKTEQQKIGSILSNIDSLIQLQRNSKEKLEHLKKSLMQKLLTGNVRVKI